MKYKVISSPVLYPETRQLGSAKNPYYKPLDTHVNLEWLLDHFKTEIKYNLMTRQREITIPEHFISPEDPENDSLALVEYLATLNDFPIKRINDHLNRLALGNSYHPIVECIKNNPWDGIKRLDNFLNTIHSTNQELSHILINTWMRAAIAAAHSIEGFINHGAIVLQGKQGIGKTAWIKALDPIGCNAIKEGAILEPGNKDCLISLSRHWIVELGELDATYRKSDISRIKSFITTQADRIRNPYARNDHNSPRRTAYIATVNESNYLVDDTGNRRWWTIEALEIDYQHSHDMKQIWSEVYHDWKNGGLTYLPNDIQQSVNKTNSQHERTDPIKEKLLTHYDWSSIGRKWLTATQVMEELGYKNIDRSNITNRANFLIEINGSRGKRTHGVTKHEVPIHIALQN